MNTTKQHLAFVFALSAAAISVQQQASAEEIDPKPVVQTQQAEKPLPKQAERTTKRENAVTPDDVLKSGVYSAFSFTSL